MTLAELNAASREALVAHLGGVFEHSPWVAELACGKRPFATREALHAVMIAAVRGAGEERRLALLRAHPELAGGAAVQGEMTDFSTREQGGSGLLNCSPQELSQLQDLNRAYAAKFGFPFIIAVKGLDRAGIIEAFVHRSGNSPEAEAAEALRQVGRITGLRLAALVQD